MDDSIISSPAKEHKPKEICGRPSARLRERGEIYLLIGVLKSTIRDIYKSESSDNPCKGKTFKLKLLKRADI